MIKLHGFGNSFGLVDPSPFVIKIDAYLRFSGIEYESDHHSKNLQKAPKGKLPFITDLESNQKIADSQAIIKYLVEKYGDQLDSGLSASQKAQSYLITKSLDENLYFCLVYSRWLCDDTWPIVKKTFFGFLPPLVRNIVPAIVRQSVKKSLKGQGLTRHDHEEILEIYKQSLSALSDLLGEQEYFYGDNPTSLDAACYGHIVGFIMSEIKNPFNQIAAGFDNLVAYCERIEKRFYSEK